MTKVDPPKSRREYGRDGLRGFDTGYVHELDGSVHRTWSDGAPRADGTIEVREFYQPGLEPGLPYEYISYELPPRAGFWSSLWDALCALRGSKKGLEA